MHIRVFDKAVKRYRERIHHLKPASRHKGHHFHLWGHRHKHEHLEPPHSSSIATLTQTRIAAEKQISDLTDFHARAHESLHVLPSEVLRHAETFHTYIQLFVNDGNIIDTQRGSGVNAITTGGMAEVSSTLRTLLDEIAVLGGIGKAMKEEILQDPQARHVCFS